jgi:ADP-ribose pyrophosphatase
MQEIERTQHYHGRAFDVYQVKVRMPDAHEKLYDLVAHPGAVVIVPVDHGEIFFVRQYRLGASESLLELPAGVLNAGESPDDCARREIREETGQGAKTWQKLGEFYIAPGYCDEYQHIYLATDLVPDPLEPDSDEFIEVEKFPIEKVYRMVFEGKIRDAKTLAALLFAKPYLSP